jgi:serine phosphatase RsbU (regulator of sigma subunit)
MFRNLKLGSKILITFLAIAVVMVGSTGYFAYSTGKTALEKSSFNKLTAVREMKAGQIEDYFRQITDQVISFSRDRMVIEAMRSFQTGFETIDNELGLTSAEMVSRDGGLRVYYENEFLERLTPFLSQEVATDDFWPKEDATRILQYLYTANNAMETGSKHLLDDASDGSRYSATHALYHPIVRDYLERFGYYDIFLIDLDGAIVYSVFKEVDYGTSLLRGPYKETNFARAYRAAREVGDTEFWHLVDFEPYEPSYGAPASFIASPIVDGDEQIGVLVFQMPIDKINDVMTNHENWADVGLGESGETYIVGDDFTLRNQSRFLIEDRESYLRQIETAGLPAPVIHKIRTFNTSIGLQRVSTPGVKAALTGETGTAIFPDYRDLNVLSAYRPLAIPGVNWAIMSEIDEAEAFAPVFRLRDRIAVFLIVAIALTFVGAYLFSRSITRPVKALTVYAHELSVHDFNQGTSFKFSGDLGSLDKRKDEVGELAAAFEQMQGDLERSVARLVESTVARERMQSELSIGREIQMSMLPLLFPAFPERKEFTLHADLHPAREVGGDWYDVFFIDEDRLCFCVGDVSGKGVPSALFMAVTKTLLKSRTMEVRSTAAAIAHVNEELSVANKNFMFATIFICVLNVKTGELLFTNAGHNPAFVKSTDGTTTRLDSKHGFVVGPLRESVYEEEKITLKRGDTLLLYTDGITEAMNPNSEMFSEQRLVSRLESTDLETTEDVVHSLVSTVKTFEAGSEQADDITVLAVQYLGSSS